MVINERYFKQLKRYNKMIKMNNKYGKRALAINHYYIWNDNGSKLHEILIKLSYAMFEFHLYEAVRCFKMRYWILRKVKNQI